MSLIYQAQQTIQQYQYCQLQNRIMNDGTISDIIQVSTYDQQNVQDQFYLKCDQNLIVVYYPMLQVFDLRTGQPIAEFLNLLIHTSPYQELSTQKLINIITLKDFQNTVNC
ncbi:hypothetical protein TTHERM_000912203 (macronuclear) [Tetrahymena thermophila SB210]|uniref:Uncharacterized protein n=1 Tax=Tetrahymena thermophila (strain SB210) TaxID=312017 RepID=W7X7T0_TETTS|nr:hypothetical protein TTHERM_000912203 [Tetrahymena thermophila SB210]EWS73397.1 hypothetical protein TTHERM_000912203 [Tetrahymena thermophila SB210]|eukprot:XP_012654070.1 hypothetical protein TTHERM_000912203 [Tetrahymena thermophila SB210]